MSVAPAEEMTLEELFNLEAVEPCSGFDVTWHHTTSFSLREGHCGERARWQIRRKWCPCPSRLRLCDACLEEFWKFVRTLEKRVAGISCTNCSRIGLGFDAVRL